MTPLEQKFQTPDGWQWGQITPRTGQSLRYGWVAPKNAQGLCVIFPGLSEYCEKYFEVVHDLIDHGMAVACIDWRGQGRSWRHLPDTQKRHHDDFALDVQDAIALLAALDKQTVLSKLPKMVLGHSMGGHIALRVMHGHKNVFRCAVLTSPMFGINFSTAPRMFGINLPIGNEQTARITTDLMCFIGKSRDYVLGCGPWSMPVFLSHLNILTSDYDRRAIITSHMKDDADLRTGGFTYGWLRAAMNSIRDTTQDPEWLNGVTTPTLVFMAERETIVSNDSIKAGVPSMPSGSLVEIYGALHEILLESPKYRNKFWQGFDSYVAKHIKPM